VTAHAKQTIERSRSIAARIMPQKPAFLFAGVTGNGNLL